LHKSDEKFQKRSIPTFQLDIETIFPNNIHLVAEVVPSAKWRLIEEYGIDCFTQQENGLLRFEEDFANEDHVLSWILGFGDQMTILEPTVLKDKYLNIISNIVKRYK
jgi:predicted DNA-binding transcriptional regulator YafY